MSQPTAFWSVFRPFAPAAVALVLVAVLAGSGALAPLNLLWYDAMQQRMSASAPLPDDTALVLIDEQSLQALGRDPFAMRWPWPRTAFAALLVGLERAGAREIIVDLILLEHSDAAEDAVMGAVAAGLPHVTLGAKIDADRGNEQLPVVWPEEFRVEHPELFAQRLRWGFVNTTPDPDGVIRRYATERSLAAAGRPRELPAVERSGRSLLRWRGGLEQLRERGVPAVPAAPFVTAGWWMLDRATVQAPDLDPASLVDAIRQEPPPEGEIFGLVHGRTVFVGANAAGTFDAVATPVGAPEPGVIVHWTAATNLIFDDFLDPAGTGVIALVVLLVVAAVGMAGRRGLGLRQPGLVAAGGAVGVAGGSWVLFGVGFWLPPAAPVVGAALAFSSVAVQSFRLERARKREIQGWFGAYVSPAVVRRLVDDPDALNLGGERRPVSIYFSDIVGFTSLSEKLPAEQLVRLTNACLEALSGPILDCGGYLDKYIGDAVMGVFGAPEEIGHHALAACRAALEGRRRLSALNENLRREHGVAIGVRFGINTGEVVVGNVGSSRKRNYTVLGDAVNLASRLEGANKEFHTEILIGPHTAAAVAGELALRPVARLRVKGKAQAVEVFELIGERTELDPAMGAFVSACASGYAAYGERRFAEAEKAFEEAAKVQPDDFLTQRYLAETRLLAANSPPLDWEPILQLHTK